MQYLCLAFLAALATACALVGLKKVGKCLYTRLSPASLVVLTLAAVITICEAQKRGDSGATGDPPAPVQQTGTTGVPPVEDITDTFHFSAISVPTSGTVTLTTAWTNGLLTAGQTIDILVKTDLRDEAWTWLTNGVVEAGTTNKSWTIENQSPSNSFYKAVVRDTLSDYAEAYVSGTDPFLLDTDGDGISDAVEVSEQTDPVDGLNFCFTCTASVSNVDAVYTNGCCSYLIGQEISAPVTSFVGSATVELPHVTVTDGVVPRVVAWMDVNANGTWEVGEPRAIQTLTITNHGLSVSIDLLQVDGDMDGDKMPDVWEVLHGFCPTNSADAFEDPDGDTLPNLFEYRYSTNPHNPLDGSNTVYSILARSVDDRLRAKIDAEGDVRHIYVDFTNTVQSGGDFIPNTDAWTYGLDFASSGVKSIRAVGTENGLTPILISDRHVMEATHCDHRTNDVVWFRAPGGTMYERTIVGMKHCQNSANDVSIGILNEPLPNDVIPVKFLPENYRQYIWDGERLPTIRVNKYSQAVVQEISRIPPANVTSYSMTIPEVQYRISDDVPRESFRVDTLWGDSGHPNFLVAGNAMIFLFPTHNTPLGNPFCGMSCLSICLKSEIETMMNDLCGEHGITNHYSVQQFDFSLLVSD